MVAHDGLLSLTGTVLSGLGTTLNGISAMTDVPESGPGDMPG